MLRKKKENEPKTIGKIIDFSPIKDFIDYGLNKTLINLKIKRLVDIQSREALSKMKPETNWTNVMVTVLVVIIVGVLAFVIINQFMNYQDMAKQVADLTIELGQCRAGQCPAVPTTPSGGLVG